MKIEQLVQITKLYEIYKNSFNDKQRDIFELFIYKNLQLNEIAEIKKITRQAVYNQIKISTKKLEKLENDFEFLKKHNEILKKLHQLIFLQNTIIQNLVALQKNKKQIIKRNDFNSSKKLLNEAMNLINEIKKEIMH